MVRSGLQTVDAQAKLAQSLGTTVASIQTLERAGELAGVSMSGIEQATKDVTRRLSQAAAGTGPAANALDRLGLSGNELIALPLDQRVGAINAAIEEFVPAAERAAVAGQIFGEEGSIAMSRIDTATLRQATEDVLAFGVVVSEQDADQIERTNDAISRLGLIWRGLSNQLAFAAAPALEAVANAMAAVASRTGPLGIAIRGLFDNIGRLTTYAATLGADPHLARIHDPALLQLERHLGEHVVPDVFFVGQHLVDGRARPRAAEIGAVSFGVQGLRDFALWAPLAHEHLVHALDDPLFLLGAGDQNHAVGLKALLLAARQLALRIAMLVDQHAAEPVPGRIALAIAQFDETALPGEDFYGKLAAVFASHHPLDGLQQVRADAAVILELLAAVVDPDPGAGTDVLVTGAFVGVLKPAPPADVIDEDSLEVGIAGLDLGHQVLQSLSAVEPQSRASRVLESPKDRQPSGFSVLANDP